MPLIIPQLDDRDYKGILDELVARIPVHTPEWTNFNDADPGITLLQLFAFMGESILYRSNLIPERNRLKFLQLLGIGLRSASPASGVVTLNNERGPLETITLTEGLRVAAGNIAFMTRNGLDVLPVESRVFWRRRLGADETLRAGKIYEQLYDSFADDTTEPEYYETVPMDLPSTGTASAVSLNDDTVDGSLWIALLARKSDKVDPASVRPKIEGKTLSLGIMPWTDVNSTVLHPAGSTSSTPVPLVIEIATGRIDGGQPVYRALDVTSDANPAEQFTIVQATIPQQSEFGLWTGQDPLEEGVGEYPPSLDDEDVKKRLVTWLRLRFGAPSAAQSASWKARLSWVGLNAARVSQRARVTGEPVGIGNGEPDQSFTLANRPVIPETLVLFAGGELWTRTEDLLTAPPEVPVSNPGLPQSQRTGDPRVFSIDAESGEIRFGDGLRGKRPPANALLFASYEFGGGRSGMVGIGAIKTSADLPPGVTCHNPLPTWGGFDGESVDEAERAIPRYLRHRDRAVSADDVRDIVLRTPGVDLRRVEVLPLYQAELRMEAPGVYTVLVLPYDARRPEAPQPDRFILEAVCRHLNPRRLLTSEVFVYGPKYLGISISIGFDVVAGRDIAPIREDVKAAIRNFLSPLTGGPDFTGWPLRKSVEDREIFAVATRVPGVSKLRGVRMWNEQGVAVSTLDIQGLELPRLDRIQVVTGDPEDLMAASVVSAPGKKRLPVPVLPAEC
ncbi:MAG: putative baseplate assembly protein [Bryobacteraceae bacterium]